MAHRDLPPWSISQVQQRHRQAAPAPKRSTSMSNTRAVLVVLTGRRNDWDALEWASAEAAARGSGLRIVHPVRWPTVADLTGSPYIDRDMPAIAAAADRVLAEATRRAQAIAPSLDIEVRVEGGLARRNMQQAELSGVMVVLGHGGGRSRPYRLVSRLLGLTDPFRSDAESILDAVDAPVVLVNLRPEALRPHRSVGQVVVGVDPTVDPLPALRFAFDAAGRRGVGLLLLRPLTSDETDVSDRGRNSSRRLNRGLERCRTAFPHVQVAQQHVTTRLSRALIDHSTAAALVVIGTNRRAGLRATLPGGVAPCLHRSVGTVAIVRTRA